MDGRGLRSAYEANRLARARADADGAFVRERILPDVDRAIGRACDRGERSLRYDLPFLTGRRPAADVLRALSKELTARGYRVRPVPGQARSLDVAWGGLYGL